MWENIIDFLQNNSVFRIIIDAYFIFVVVFSFLVLLFKNKNLKHLILPLFIFGIFTVISNLLNLEVSSKILNYCALIIPVCLIIISAPNINEYLTNKTSGKETHYVKATTDDKDALVSAIYKMSDKHIGAIITFEKHKLLDSFVEKAIELNADITEELLLNIFSPLTPLHDGGVIIKGNKIRCAGAYFTLSTREISDKTVGSRHRAALGISESSDSITIVVSEETGHISVAYSGILITINDKEKLLEYLELAME